MVDLGSYEEFKKAIAMKESGDNYQVVNKFGYLGRYQFGLARLTDFDLCQRKNGLSGYANNCFVWVSPYSQGAFLSSPELQDHIFDLHVSDLVKRIRRVHGDLIGTDIRGVRLDLSGAVACCHLLGIGGLSAWVNGEEREDGFGTKASDYIKEFSGYTIVIKIQKRRLADLIS